MKRRSRVSVKSAPTKSRLRSSHGRSSCFRGVTQHRRTKKWEAHIWDDHRQIYLGGFDSEEDAARAHDIMALKCRGDNGLTNYSQNDYAALLPELDKTSKDEVRKLIMSRRLPSAPDSSSPVKIKGRKGAARKARSDDSKHSFLGLLNASEDESPAVSTPAVAAAPQFRAPDTTGTSCKDDTSLLQGAPISSPVTMLMGLAQPQHEPCLSPFDEPCSNPLLDIFSSHNFAAAPQSTPTSSNQTHVFKDSLASHERLTCSAPDPHKLTSDLATFQTKIATDNSSMQHKLNFGNGYSFPIPDVSRFESLGHVQNSPCPSPQGRFWDGPGPQGRFQDCPNTCHPATFNANRQTDFWQSQDTELNVVRPNTADLDITAAYHQCLDDSVHSVAIIANPAIGLGAHQMHADLHTDMDHPLDSGLPQYTEQWQTDSTADRRYAPSPDTQSSQAGLYKMDRPHYASSRQTEMTAWQIASGLPLVTSPELEHRPQSATLQLQNLAYADAVSSVDRSLLLKRSMTANLNDYWPAKASQRNAGTSPQLKPLFLSSFDAPDPTAVSPITARWPAVGS